MNGRINGIEQSSFAEATEDKAVDPHEDFLVLETYDMLEKLFVGHKPGSLYAKNTAMATAVHDALVCIYEKGYRDGAYNKEKT